MPTKIAPTIAKPGEDFTIVDTPQGRLAAGAAALFKTAAGGTAASAALKTHGPQMTAQGVVPSTLSTASYQVSVSVNGTSFDVGSLQVQNGAGGVVYAPPSITPTQGAVGSLITIDDSQKRLQTTDQARFYLPGGDPLTGTVAPPIDVLTDGSRLTANVPGVTPNMDYMVAVISTVDGAIRFQELSFYVTANPL